VPPSLHSTPVICRKLLSLLLLPGLCGSAQHSGGVRSGDQPIPGATISASSGERKIVTTTDESGKYTLTKLGPGTWTIEVEMFGFVTARQQLLVVDSDTRLEWTLELKPFTPAPLQSRTPQRPVQDLTVNETAAVDEVRQDAVAPSESAENANEAFLVNGSVSGGLNVGAFEQVYADAAGDGLGYG
jgi:hypothetical protein